MEHLSAKATPHHVWFPNEQIDAYTLGEIDLIGIAGMVNIFIALELSKRGT